MTKKWLAIMLTIWLLWAISCSDSASDKNNNQAMYGSGGSNAVTHTATGDAVAAGGNNAPAIDAGQVDGNIPIASGGFGETVPSAGAGGSGGNAPLAGVGGSGGNAPLAEVGGDAATEPVAGASGTDGGSEIPQNAPAPADVSKWADPGPFGSRVVNNSGPDGQFTLFVPDPLAGNGTPNPIITWGNGSFTTPNSYTNLLSHYATYGFFVIASNSTDVGTGQEMIAGMRWAIAENSRTGSEYYGKLDSNAVGSIGYSQGGIGAVITGNEPEVKTTVPIAGGDASIKTIEHPIFLVGNENDTLAPIDVISRQYPANEKSTFVFAILLGAGHLETLGNGGRHRGYTTAWLAYHLLGDQEAYRIFFGDEQCTLCTDPEWDTQRKNLP